MFSKKILTYIKHGGHSVFQGSVAPVCTSSSNNLNVDAKWIRSISCIIQGVPDITFLHREIRLPFGTELSDNDVEQSVQECLGANRNKYGNALWHEFFQEDTNQGTQHRVFISFLESEELHTASPEADMRMPLESAALALATRFQEETGESDFQIILSCEKHLFSILFLGGSPYHLLRILSEDRKYAVDRLKKHAEYGLSAASKSRSLRIFLLPPSDDWLHSSLAQDPLWEPERVNPEAVFHGFAGPERKEDKGTMLFRYGLFLAGNDPDLVRHDRASQKEKGRIADIRDAFRLKKALLVSGILSLAVIAFFGWKLWHASVELRDIKDRAAAYQEPLAAISLYRQQKQQLIDTLQGLRPLWHLPVPWHRVFHTIISALPEQSGMDAFLVEKTRDGTLELRFKAWMKDWDRVATLQDRLNTSPLFSEVTLSDQKKNLKKGTVHFHVSCKVERF
jgi:hypothetical protein